MRSSQVIFRPHHALSAVSGAGQISVRRAGRHAFPQRGITTITAPTGKPPPVSPVTAEVRPRDDLLKNSRFKRLRNAVPFSPFLTDSFHRQHSYLRISITERCNLRCTYCMPEAGVPLSPEDDNLTTPEILLLSELFVAQGVNKIRLTGGEPTIRKDILSLMQRLGKLRSKGLQELALTTNGVALWRKLDAMAEAGLTGVNLSLDTLDPHLFQIITRRKGFDAVIKSMDRIQELNKLGAGIRLKINCVVTRGVNDREILDFVELGKEKDIEVRFIEYMPFDGNKWEKKKMFSYHEMLQLIKSKYPRLHQLHDKKGDTSKTWQVPGFTGKIGFITSMTENFCGTCNRLRITSDGNLKVCLFGNSEVSLRDLLRENTGGLPVDEAAFAAMRELEDSDRVGPHGIPAVFKDDTHQQRLLDVIGRAVGRKKARHAGMENLSIMPNRPMILIDELQRSFRSAIQDTVPAIRSFRAPALNPNPYFRVPRQALQPVTAFARHVRYFTQSCVLAEEQPDVRQPEEVLNQRVTEFLKTPSGIQTFEDALSNRATSVLMRHFELFKDHPESCRGPKPRTKMWTQFFQEANGIQKLLHLAHDDPVFKNKLLQGQRIKTGKVRVILKARKQAKRAERNAGNDDGPKPSSQLVPFMEEQMPQKKLARYSGNRVLSGRTPEDQTPTTQPPSTWIKTSAQADTPGVTLSQPLSARPASSTRPSNTIQSTNGLPHLTAASTVHMVSVAQKAVTSRQAVACAIVQFRDPAVYAAIQSHAVAKGDVLAVARIAAIMGAKRTADIIPLCHPGLQISNIEVDVEAVSGQMTQDSQQKRAVAPSGLEGNSAMLWRASRSFLDMHHPPHGAVKLVVSVRCEGKTGVEMEALSGVMAGALTVVDMCKAMDKALEVDHVKVVYKDGGRSGFYMDKQWLELAT